jgi:hypothetical protein
VTLRRKSPVNSDRFFFNPIYVIILAFFEINYSSSLCSMQDLSAKRMGGKPQGGLQREGEFQRKEVAYL